MCSNCQKYDSYHKTHEVIQLPKNVQDEEEIASQQSHKSQLNIDMDQISQGTYEEQLKIENSIMQTNNNQFEDISGIYQREIQIYKNNLQQKEDSYQNTPKNSFFNQANTDNQEEFGYEDELNQNEDDNIIQQVEWIDHKNQLKSDYYCETDDKKGYLRFQNKDSSSDLCCFCKYEIMFTMYKENSNFLKIKCSDCYNLNKNVSKSCCQIIKRDIPDIFRNLQIPTTSSDTRELVDCNDYIGKQGKFGFSANKFVSDKKSQKINGVKSYKKNQEIENKKPPVTLSLGLQKKLDQENDKLTSNLVDLFNSHSIKCNEKNKNTKKNQQKTKKK